MDMEEDYRPQGPGLSMNNPHQHGATFRFCPVCGGGLESRLLKAGERSYYDLLREKLKWGER